MATSTASGRFDADATDGEQAQRDLARSLIAAVGIPFALAFARERQWHGVIRHIERLLASRQA